METLTRLFRIATLDDRALLDRGLEAEFRERSLKPDGFVHLSFAEQIRGTLETHYVSAGEVVLLEIDPERTSDALRLEPSRGGALFPHLYRPLAPSDIVREWRVTKRGDTFELPEIASGAESDRPQGRRL